MREREFVYEVKIEDALDWTTDISLRQELVDEALVAARKHLGDWFEDQEVDTSVEVGSNLFGEGRFTVTFTWEENHG